MFLKFMQEDPQYGGRMSEVVVNVSQIVKIEPIWYTQDKRGRFRTQVTVPDEEALARGVQKKYIVHDSLGNKYHSDTTSDEGRKAIEKIWLDAV